MSFSDLTFLFYFLPLFFAVYYILPFRFKNAALVLGSFAFYFIGAGARDTLLLSGVLLLHYALARAMAGKEVRTRKALLIIALAADLFCLVYFKYAAFILENLGKLTGTAFSLVELALPLGVLAAVKQNTWVDNVSMVFSLIGVSMPIFWLAVMLIMLFSLKLGWFPVFGAKQWSSIVLPAISLGLMNMASIARTTRSSMVETIRQDYIRTAYAKGLPKRTVIMRHAFRNGLLPTITVIGLEIGQMLGGSVLTETVFAWPGIGRLMIQSVNGRDTPTVMGCIILMTVCFSIVNLLVDLLYGVFDPRVRTMYH